MIKSIIKFGLEKPILNHMLLLFVFILAIFSYFKIPKEIFPISNLDAISITGTYVGASSDMLDLMAVQKIEDELNSLSEANTITTVVKSGYFNIKVELKSQYTPRDVIDDIKDIVAQTKTNLPSDMDEPIVKEVTQSFPLITVAIFGDKSKTELLNIADDIKSQLSHFEDLSSITIFGDSDKELQIAFDDKKIEAYGLDKSVVINAISQNSSIFPAGILKDVGTHYFLSSQNGEKDLEILNNTIFKIGEKKIYQRYSKYYL